MANIEQQEQQDQPIIRHNVILPFAEIIRSSLQLLNQGDMSFIGWDDNGQCFFDIIKGDGSRHKILITNVDQEWIIFYPIDTLMSLVANSLATLDAGGTLPNVDRDRNGNIFIHFVIPDVGDTRVPIKRDTRWVLDTSPIIHPTEGETFHYPTLDPACVVLTVFFYPENMHS